jgi:hypothetical protein
MKSRALIIAVQRYGTSRDRSIGQELPYTVKGAADFREWLLTTKKVEEQDILFCTEPGVEGSTGGTTRDELAAALKQLVDGGADATSELFFYFSGHGFSSSDNPFAAPLDVLVLSDFVALEESGGACVRLREIQEKLWRVLGPGDHFYFVDACRNPIPSSAIEVTSLGTAFGPASQLGTPTVYTLYSTAQGMTAHVESRFAEYLVKGLHGEGRAKGWLRSEMWVTFELLCDYVRAHVRGQEAESEKKGSRKGTILKLDPVPESTCRISVEEAPAATTFTLTIRDVQGLQQQHEVPGGGWEIRLKPHDYFFELRHGTAVLPQVAPPPVEPVDLYEVREVRFRGTAPEHTRERAAQRRSSLAHVVIAGVPGGDVELRHVQSGFSVRGKGRLDEMVSPGVYEAKVREHGVTVRKSRVELLAGSSRTIDLATNAPLSRAHSSIVLGLGQSLDAPPNFSEMLDGPVAQPDLSLWLSLIGASRVAYVPDLLSKLGPLDLARFDDAAPDSAHLYLLAASERPMDELRAAVGDGHRTEWRLARRVPKLEDIFELALPIPLGQQFLSFHVRGLAPITMPIVGMANRVAFVVLALDPAGRASLYQFLLPLFDQLQRLPTLVGDRIAMNPLTAARTMWVVQHLFSRQRDLETAFSQNDSGNSEDWLRLSNSKWLDPILSVIAAYELIRRGTAWKSPEKLGTIIDNLRRHFHDLPDSEAIARLTGRPWEMPAGPPLLLDGFLALEDELRDRLPLPATHLNYAGPWTMWQNAVSIR